MGSSERPPGELKRDRAAPGGPLAEMPLGDVLALLAAGTPSPGGGTTAALTGASAAALTEMAANFALAHGAGEDTEIAALRERAASLRSRLLELADADVGSYGPVLDALSLPHGDDRRASALREALSAATATPLDIAAASASVAELASTIGVVPGNDALRGDAYAAIVIAEAATRAASSLVELNLAGSPEDPRLAQALALARDAAELRNRGVPGP